MAQYVRAIKGRISKLEDIALRRQAMPGVESRRG